MSAATASTLDQGPRVSSGMSTGRPRFGARRRALLLGCAALLLLVTIAANYGPLHEWRDARARLEKRLAEVADLSRQKAQLEAQVKQFGDPNYIEGLARQDLTYARPGEDVFIVTGLGGNTGQADASPTGGTAAQKPGFLERILSALGRLF
jgi:cell division protein FtsB